MLTWESEERDHTGEAFAAAFRASEQVTVLPFPARPRLEPSSLLADLLLESPTERVANRIEELEQEKNALLEQLDDRDHTIEDLRRELAHWQENGILATPVRTDDDEEDAF